MDKKALEKFLLLARTKTYAGAEGKTQPAFAGSSQLEYKEKAWLYRDIYYTGKDIFTGLETVYFDGKPAWSMCYYGNFKKMSEEETDSILRRALMENWQTTRLYKRVEWSSENYQYLCEPDLPGSIDEVAGVEKILKDGQEVYLFYYAGGLVWKG